MGRRPARDDVLTIGLGGLSCELQEQRLVARPLPGAGGLL